MSIYKRGETGYWWIQFTDSSGRRIQQSAGTKDRKEAQELHDKLKADSWRKKQLGESEAIRYTWQQAVVRWLTEQIHKKSLRDDKLHLRWLNPYLAGKHLDEINKTLIDHIKLEKKATGASNATVNRVLAVIRSILKRAEKEWEWLDKAPYVRLYPEPQKRVRWLTRPEVQCLANELPEHLRSMMLFTLATGLRESNVTQMQWSQIDLQRRCAWIHADQAKGKQAIPVPLNDDAITIIKQQLGNNAQFVFTYQGDPVGRANNHAWRKALKRAGIEDFRWHDLRHTWASWHVQSGTPLHVLQELGGWTELSMVQKYAHLSTDHLADFAQNVSARSEGNVTFLRQSQKNS